MGNLQQVFSIYLMLDLKKNEIKYNQQINENTYNEIHLPGLLKKCQV